MADRIDLPNNLILEIHDESQQIAMGRWMLQLVLRIEISVDPSLFNGRDTARATPGDLKQVLGETIRFEKKLTRNFIDDREKDDLLEKMKKDVLKTVIPYLSHQKFATQFILKKYGEVTNQSSWSRS